MKIRNKKTGETREFDCVCVNSALVSAQNRQRLYWVGKRNADGTYSKVDVEQPEDRGILLRDVLDGIALKDKQNCIDANYYKGGNYSNPKKQSGQRMCVAEPVCMRYERSEQAKRMRKDYESGKIKHGYHEYSELHPRTDGKSNTLSTVLKDNPICEPVRVGLFPTSDGRLLDSQGMRVYSVDAKSVTQSAQGGCMGAKTGLYAIPVYKELTDNEMDYMVRDYSGRRWNFCQRPAQDNKAKCLVANIAKGVPYNVCAIPVEFENGIPTKAISYADGKTYKVYEVKNGQITIKEKQYPIKLYDGYYIIRKLTVSECKRLQTVPEWYEFPVSNTRAYSMLGNGWTIDVIVHLIEVTRM